MRLSPIYSKRSIFAGSLNPHRTFIMDLILMTYIWCYQNGINRHAFNAAIKRLRKRAVTVPSHKSSDIDRLPLLAQDIVQASILPDATVPPADILPHIYFL